MIATASPICFMTAARLAANSSGGNASVKYGASAGFGETGACCAVTTHPSRRNASASRFMAVYNKADRGLLLAVRGSLLGARSSHRMQRRTMDKIRWGVLGVAKIATEKVIPAMQRGERSTVTAIASRDLREGARGGGEARSSPRRTGLTRSSSPIRRSTPSTIRCPITSTCPGRSRPPNTASTCSARSRSGCLLPRRATSWRCAIAPAFGSRKRSWSARIRSG